MAKKDTKKDTKKQIPKNTPLTLDEMDQLIDTSFLDEENAPPPLTSEEAILYINNKINTTEEKHSIIKRASQASNPFTLRRPFNIASLDIATGGGLPVGGITQLISPPGVGKNSLSGQLIATCQKIYGENSSIAWVCTEMPIDKQHLRINGVIVPSSTKDLIFENQQRRASGEDLLSADDIAERKKSIGEFLVVEEGTTEQRLQAVVELVKANSCQLIIVDSLNASISKYRTATPLENEPKQSSEAAMLTNFQQLLWSAYTGSSVGKFNYTTIVAIGQVRANRNRKGLYSREWASGGPWAIRHGKLVDITLSQISTIPKSGSKKTGKTIGFHITKAKAGCHEGGKGEVNYYYKTGYDRYTDVIATANYLGLLTLKGPYYHIIDSHGEVLFDKLTGGLKGLTQKAYEDENFFTTVYQACLRKAKVSCLHKLL
jgi:RecA/RadA recombinase